MSFWELLVVVVVGLLVVGPDRLPDALRTGMLWFGRVKRTINDTRVEFEQQLGMDEIRRELHNEQVMKSLKALEQAKEDAESGLDEMELELQREVKKIEDSIDDPVHHDDTQEQDTQQTDALDHKKDLNPEPANRT